jgi:hypothetical protein
MLAARAAHFAHAPITRAGLYRRYFTSQQLVHAPISTWSATCLTPTRSGDALAAMKALGTSFVVALLLSVLASNTAQAAPFFDTDVPVASLHGTSETPDGHFLTEAGTVECSTVHYTGSVTDGSSTLTLSTNQTGCKAFGFINATVTSTGCNHVLHLTETVEHDWYKAHVDVSCESGKSIRIVAGTCEIAIDSQSGITTVDITDMTPINGTNPSDITLKWTAQGISYTVLKDGFGCPFSGTGTKTGGEYTGGCYVTITAASGRIEATGA